MIIKNISKRRCNAHYMSTETRKLFLQSLVLCSLDHCPVVWSSAAKKTLNFRWCRIELLDWIWVVLLGLTSTECIKVCHEWQSMTDMCVVWFCLDITKTRQHHSYSPLVIDVVLIQEEPLMLLYSKHKLKHSNTAIYREAVMVVSKLT